MATVSPQKRREILDALRRGTVPRSALDAFAIGLDRFEATLDDELRVVKSGGSVFKAVRGEYGSGKTFFARWLAERAKRNGFAAAEVQISESETPLHRLETVYRRMMEQISTSDADQGAFRRVLDSWFFTLEEDLLAAHRTDVKEPALLLEKTTALMEQRLSGVSRTAPMFSAALRGYRAALAGGEPATAEAIAAWLSGQPNVAASAKRFAGVKGEIDHFGALSFLQGFLAVLRDAGYGGLLLVLDEVETVQRMRSDVREKSLNALRQLIDEVDSGHFPGLFLVITGTAAFFEGPNGARRLEPLYQRLHVDFETDARFDNPRAVQVRLAGFDMEKLRQVGERVRDIYVLHGAQADRIGRLADDAFVEELASAVTGKLGGKVGIAPRVFLKKLVADVLDRIDQFPDFEPRRHYKLTLVDGELTPVERQATGAVDVDDIELDT